MTDLRWKQRFDSLSKAKQVLLEAVQLAKADPSNKFMKIALIGSFQFCKKLIEYVRNIRKINEIVANLFCFSRAMGGHKPGSDIDFAILTSAQKNMASL